MVNYNNSKIYKIICNTTGFNYIGSTCQELGKRLNKHRWDYKNKLNLTSCKILENNNYEIVLIENYPCKNKQELLLRERYWIENLECVNNNLPIMTIDDKVIYYKSYYEKNKDNIITRQTSYYKNNKDKIKSIRNVYLEKNKDKINEYQRLYRQKKRFELP